MEGPKLYRKRFIPEETTFLRNDIVLYRDEEVILTKWNVLRPRKDFAKGVSCYFLKKGYKISKFLNEKDELVYYYCDIIETSYEEKTDSYLFTDLLADVIIYENGFMKVVDLGEIAVALDKGLISQELVKKALLRLDELLNIIYTEGHQSLVQSCFEQERAGNL